MARGLVALKGLQADRPERAEIYLHPGHVFVSSESHAVMTILGSCVAVCLWDPVLMIGGMNHYLLPYASGNESSSTRFGNVAIQSLIGQLLGLGSAKGSLQAKLFGGACVLEAMRGSEHHIGTKNIQVARTVLAEEGIPVVGEDVGGRHGRKLIFQVDDGTAWVKPLGSSNGQG